MWAGEMAQLIKGLATKPDYMSSVSVTHMVNETPESCPLIPMQVLWHTHTHVYT